METEVSVDQLEHLPKWSWLVRPCEKYKEELRDCRSIKAKFHQYFINGETEDCSQWKTDYVKCMDYRQNKDTVSLSAVIESEKDRRKKRLRGHVANTVWERRESPPDDWNKPLPEGFAATEGSYLALKSKEQKEGKNPEESKSLCTIS